MMKKSPKQYKKLFSVIKLKSGLKLWKKMNSMKLNIVWDLVDLNWEQVGSQH